MLPASATISRTGVDRLPEWELSVDPSYIVNVPCDRLSDIAALAHDCGISEECDDLLLASGTGPRTNFVSAVFRMLPSCIDQCLLHVRHISLRLHKRRTAERGG